MFLFSRAVNLHGSPRKTVPWVQQITAKVNSAGSLDVSAWIADFGLPLGTVVWNTVVESQAQFAEAMGPMAGDDSYLDLLEAGQELITAPGEDALREMVYGSPDGTDSVGSVAQVTSGIANVDRIGDAIAWSVDIAQHVEKITGNSVSVWTSTYGQMGEITFIGVLPGLAELDATHTATNGDAGYLERLHASGGLWVPGSGQVSRFTRMF